MTSVAPGKIHVEVVAHRGEGFYVYWETASTCGSRGATLNREQAEWLAERIRNGEVRP